MIRYSLTIFLSAFLLFQVQPMIARFILPWFGGTAAVWTTCMMFFQIALLVGYCYAHLLRRCFHPNQALFIHASLLLFALLLGSVAPRGNWRPEGDANPTWVIVGILGLSIGLPFVTLATTGPLVQAWQTTSHAGRSAYRLYALSNLGSMLALLSYPFLVERFMSLALQVLVWRVSFALFVVLCFWSQWQTIGVAAAEPSASNDESQHNEQVMGWKRWQPPVWVLLATAASIVLLATTNLMCQEIASVPFLWILPLSLYLLSFIVCFDRPALYRRAIWTPLLIVSVIVATALIHFSVFAGLVLQVAGLATVCFAASMTCHGELERLKPPAARLTSFYLWISVGGALGGVFVCIVAPRVFNGFYEFHCGVIVALMIALIVALRASITDRVGRSDSRATNATSKFALYAAALGVFFALGVVGCSLAYYLDPTYHANVVYQGRNEYGLVSVVDQPNLQYRRFVNGRIEHGGQSLIPAQAMEHTGYYVAGSGVAVAFDAMREIQNEGAGRAAHTAGSEKLQGSDDPNSRPSDLRVGLNVGVIGLGAGAMATWLEPDDQCVFYEINPLVETIARKYFSFLENCRGVCRVVLGDGRLQLENRIRQSFSQSFPNDLTESRRSPANMPVAAAGQVPKVSHQLFDLLIMDAFSSDAIPIHLLTRECFEVYLSNLKGDGILVAHITNRFVDLLPVLKRHAADFDLTPILVEHQSEDGRFETRWLLMTRNQAVAETSSVRANQLPFPQDLDSILWTDDSASLAAVINWSAGIDWEKIRMQLDAEAVDAKSVGNTALNAPSVTTVAEPANADFESK